MPELWAGTDAGKAEHHCTVIDTGGKRRLSRRVANDEDTLLQLIADVLALSEGEPVTWAIDLNAGGAALMIALLTDNGQKILYIPGRTVHHASGSYRGNGKTDAKDAFVIADQARMRRDLQTMHRGDDISVDLRILTSRRLDLAADRTRAINRMRAQMLEYFPALERAFDYSTSKASLVLLTGYQTPSALRRVGKSRLAVWLKNRKVRNFNVVAAAAVAAAEAQHAVVPGEKLAAAVVAKLAREVMALDEEIAETDALIEGRFREHPHAEVILSMPGIGPILGAEFIAHTGGDMSVYGSSDRLAGVAGLGAGPEGLGTDQRQHAPATTLLPTPDASLLHVRHGRCPVLPHLEGVLRTEEGRGQGAPASRHRTRAPSTERAVGPHTRRPHLRNHGAPEPHSTGLTRSQ